MDYFEALVRTLLEAEGYWTRQSFKVNLTREEKRAVANPSIPRPEIDLLAYKPGEEEILAIEVKSYLDSNGVSLKELKQVQSKIAAFAHSAYENDPVIIAARVLLRDA